MKLPILKQEKERKQNEEERVIGVTGAMEKHMRTHSADVAMDYPHKSAVTVQLCLMVMGKGRFDTMEQERPWER